MHFLEVHPVEHGFCRKDQFGHLSVVEREARRKFAFEIPLKDPDRGLLHSGIEESQENMDLRSIRHKADLSADRTVCSENPSHIFREAVKCDPVKFRCLLRPGKIMQFNLIQIPILRRHDFLLVFFVCSEFFEASRPLGNTISVSR